METNIGHEEMKDLITLYTKNVPFTFIRDIYQLRDGIAYQVRYGIAMRSLSGPIVAEIIMAGLKNSIFPKLNSYLGFWKGYVDATLIAINER